MADTCSLGTIKFSTAARHQLLLTQDTRVHKHLYLLESSPGTRHTCDSTDVFHSHHLLQPQKHTGTVLLVRTVDLCLRGSTLQTPPRPLSGQLFKRTHCSERGGCQILSARSFSELWSVCSETLKTETFHGTYPNPTDVPTLLQKGLNDGEWVGNGGLGSDGHPTWALTAPLHGKGRRHRLPWQRCAECASVPPQSPTVPGALEASHERAARHCPSKRGSRACHSLATAASSAPWKCQPLCQTSLQREK